MLNNKQIQELERQAIIAALFRICDPRGMEKENLKTGDTVKLKSGGPVMTLGSSMAAGGYKCHWFHGAELREGLFYLDELQKAEPEKEWDGTS